MLKFSRTHLTSITGCEAVDGGYIGTHNDPQFQYVWPRPFKPGWYKFALQFDAPINDTPKIYFDFGNGFNETQCSVLANPSGDKLNFQSLVKIPKAPKIVRLDPVESPTKFVFQGLIAKRLPFLSVALRGAYRLARSAIANPRMIPALLHRTQRLLFASNFEGIRARYDANVKGDDGYATWLEAYDYNDATDRPTYEYKLEKLPHQPKISILMPVYNTDLDLFAKTIASIQGQIYSNWEICIANDASTAKGFAEALDVYAANDSRIKIVHRPENGHISRASNSALELVTGDWVALVDHDDVLPENALAEIAMAIAAHPNGEVFYSDEDKIDIDDNRFDPHFKADYSPDMFKAMNYLNHLTVHKTANIKKVDGWRVGFEGSQDYDLNLRIIETLPHEGVIHIPKILYHWRAVEGSTALEGKEKSYAWAAGQRALQEHLKRTGVDGHVEKTPDVPFYRIIRPLPKPTPSVELIIPIRDKVYLLKTAIQSIFQRTTYENYTITIVDNGSAEDETFSYLEAIEKTDSRVKVLKYDAPFNYSAINNFAVSQSKADLVGLLNNDIEIISEGWLMEMVGWAIQPHVGCVGAKLYYADETIQHAGVIAGIGGVAGHSHKYFPRSAYGYFSRLKVPQNILAVTAACLLVRRDVFNQVGGLDEKNLTVAFNDVDFCLKVYSSGLLNVWTPWAELYHYESKSRGEEDSGEKQERFKAEVKYMQKRWADLITRDPFYNPNLSDTHENFSFRK